MKLAKENRIKESEAKEWTDLYILYILHFSKNLDLTYKNFLALPYEILQCWRLHVLYTIKYNELSKLLTSDKVDYIPFVPAKYLWSKESPKLIKENLAEN